MSVNREILFRGKRLGSGEWVEGNLLTSAAYPNRAWITESKTFFDRQLDGIAFVEVGYDTVGQYIGLTDKNNVKIFAGDIVQSDSEDGFAEIRWDDFTARFTIEWDGLSADFDNFYGAELEIVGNVHDNPELLEVQDG